MTFRSIVKEDLPRLAKLADNQELCIMEDLCLEHSKMCLDDKGKVLAFVVIRQNSLIDYCGGQIPADESIDKNGKYYQEGDEYHVHRVISEYFPTQQYELVEWYLNPIEPDEVIYETFLRLMGIESKPIGVVWVEYVKGCLMPLLLRTEFYELNYMTWVSIPYVD
ncbi:MAG: hypothetical protein IJ832_00335 [Bacteroidaceae bacterium]|nr:hypothetical protein [Bacteroidaceae bacterium]